MSWYDTVRHRVLVLRISHSFYFLNFFLSLFFISAFFLRHRTKRRRRFAHSQDDNARRLPYKQAQRVSMEHGISFGSLIHYGWGPEKYLLKVILRCFVIYTRSVYRPVRSGIRSFLRRGRRETCGRTYRVLSYPSSNGHLWNYAARGLHTCTHALVASPTPLDHLLHCQSNWPFDRKHYTKSSRTFFLLPFCPYTFSGLSSSFLCSPPLPCSLSTEQTNFLTAFVVYDQKFRIYSENVFFYPFSLILLLLLFMRTLPVM